jgi:hypothetical protein
LTKKFFKLSFNVASGWISKKEVIMRYFIFLTLMFIFIFFFSCEREVVNPNIKEYFPLATGNYWEYELSNFFTSRDTTEWEVEDTFRIEVGEKWIINGKEFFEVKVISMGMGDPEELETYWMRAEDEFLLIYSEDSEDSVKIDTLLSHSHIKNGDPWSVKGPYWYEGADLFEAKYVGREKINSFDCLRVNYIHPDDCDYFYFLVEWDFSNLSFWYGKNCGIIKIVAMFDDFEGYQLKLINYKIKKEGGKNGTIF